MSALVEARDSVMLLKQDHVFSEAQFKTLK
jgi:hypothetical protein